MTDDDYQIREVLFDIRIGRYRLCIDKATDERVVADETEATND